MIWTIDCGFIRQSSTSVVFSWINFNCQAQKITWSRLSKVLTALDREGKLDGRPRDKAQLLLPFTLEKNACLALEALAPRSGEIQRAPAPQLQRLLRIEIGLMLERGHLDELSAAARSLCEIHTADPEELYQLGRSLAWCAGRFDHAGGAGATSANLKNLRGWRTKRLASSGASGKWRPAPPESHRCRRISGADS